MISRIPILVLFISFFGLWLSERIGAFLRKKQSPLDKDQQKDFTVSLSATLTLLGLIIAFSFSMAVSRYDQRNIYEEGEANAIGTEFLRADLLPADEAARVRELLRKYLDQRIAFYEALDRESLRHIHHETARLQGELWSAIRTQGVKQPTPVMAVVISGMNDVFSAQGNTQAGWRNRIPNTAWALMVVIALFNCFLIGNGARTKAGAFVPVLPFVISVALFLIAELDGPRGGFIRVHPQNLLTLSTSINSSDVKPVTK